MIEFLLVLDPNVHWDTKFGRQTLVGPQLPVSGNQNK
jgi:hypothetical protein